MATAHTASNPSILGATTAPLMERLEPRLVFDASFDMAVDRAVPESAPPLDATKPVCDIPLPQDHLLTGDRALVASLDSRGLEQRQEIIFIDAAVPDVANLLAAFSPTAEVHYLSATRGGAEQMADILAGRTGIDAIHILSHGREGSISLGTSQLTEASITGEYRQTLETIGHALTADGDILIYGCDVGANLRGFSTVSALARVTGADVAASDDVTGSVAQGGDWDLEISSGRIETTIIRAPEWDHILAPLLISVSSAPTVTGAGVAGTIGLWTNAGFLGTDAIDLRATVVSVTGTAVVGLTLGTGDDPRVTITGVGSALIRWEVFKSGTNQTVIAIGDPNFLIRDLDGIGGVGASVEGAAADLTGLNSYTTNSPTNLVLTNDTIQIRADGTLGQTAADQAAWVKFNWLNRSAWESTYFCFNASAGTRFYDHDGDGDFVFSNPIVVGLPQLDLDGNNSSGATGSNFATAYTENGSGVSIADPDIAISHASSTTLQGATIVLTNAQAGDILAAPGSLPGGISASTYNSATGTITLSGTASLADYQAAIAAITFANTTNTPSTTPRAIDVFVTDGVNKSDVARTIITVTAVNDAPEAANDTGTVTEDMVASGNVLTGLGADTDAESDSLTVTQFTVVGVPGTFTAGSTATIPGVGTLVIAANGTWSFTPENNYNGPIPVATYIVSDGNGGIDTATLTLAITPQNDPPEAVNDTGVVIEDIPALGNVLTGLGADTDVEGNPLTVTQFSIAGMSGTFSAGTTATIPGVGTLVINADGSWIFSPATNYAGVIPIVTYTVSDGNGGTDTATLALTITPQNDPPRAVDDRVTVAPTNGPVLNTVGGFEGIPSAPNPGSPLPPYVFTVGGWSAVNTDGEIITSAPGRLAFEGNQFLSVLQNAGQNTDTAWNETSSGYGGYDRAVTLINVVPGKTYTISFANAADDRYGYTGDTTLVQIQSMNTSQQQSTQFVTPGLFDWKTQTLTFTADAGTSQIALMFSAMGAGNTSALIDVVTITELIPGVTNPYVTPEDTAISIQPMLNDSDPDGDTITITHVDGQAIVAGGPSVTTAHGLVALSADGQTFTFTPALHYFGPADFTYTIADPSGLTSTATVDIEVTPVNDPPEAVNDSGTVIEDTPTTGNVLTGLGADTDVEGDPLTVTQFTVAGLPGTFAAGSTATVPGVGTLSINADGTWLFTPSNNYDGPIPIATYTVSDGNGGTDTATLTLTITPVNDTPVVVDPLNPGTPLNPTPTVDPLNIIPDIITSDSLTPASVNVAEFIRDPEGQPLLYTATGLPPGLLLDLNTGLISGILMASASQGSTQGNPPGTYTVLITVTDPAGAAVVTTLTYTITNPAPVAVNDTANVTEDMPATGNLLTGAGPAFNGRDNDPDGDTLSVTSFTVPGLVGTFTPGADATIPGVGVLTILADGSYRFVPASNYNGAVPVISYTISDGEGGVSSATLTLTILPVNDGPVVVDPANPGTALNPLIAPNPNAIIPPIGSSDGLVPPPLNLADYVRDPEGQPLTFSAVGLPPGLLLDPNTGMMSGTLTPAASQGSTLGNPPGVYSVVVTFTDSEGLSSSTTVTYTIANPAPVAQPDTGVVSEDGPTALGNVLTGIGVDTDPDGDTLSVSSALWNGMPVVIGTPFTLPNGAVLILNADGSYSFDPKSAYNGLDITETATEVFSYTISDGEGGFSTATLTLTIDGANDQPQLVDPTNLNPDPATLIPPQTGLDSGMISIPTAGVFFDPDGESLVFSVAGLPPGLVIDPVTGLISGVVLNDASQGGPSGNGAYPVTVTVTDPDGSSRTVSFVLTINNLPPVAVDDKATAQPNLPVEISVLLTDRDPDGDVLSVIAANSDNGSVTILPNGKVQFTPTRGFLGDAVIVYTISDGNGGTATARVIVNVLPEDNHIAAAGYTPWPDNHLQRSVFGPSQQGLSVLAAAKAATAGVSTMALSADRGDTGDLFRAFLDVSSDTNRTPDSPFPMRTFLGTSVGLSLAEGLSGETLWVETMFHEGRFVLKIFEKGADGKIKLVRHTLHSEADIRWLQEMSIDLHAGLPPANLESVEVDVEAMLSSGEVVHRRMVIEPRLGQVRLSE
jgi:large repetitive protein